MPKNQSMRERIGALRNLPPFLKLVWQTSPAITLALGALRLARALLPVATLYVGALIIDAVVRVAKAPPAGSTLGEWVGSGMLDPVIGLLALEFALAVASDLLGRVVSLLDSLLSERFSNATSLRLMDHAATLDLEDFEDAEMQDRLERARRQAAGRVGCMGQLFGQAQDMVTIVSFGAGLSGLCAVADRAAGGRAGPGVHRRGALQRAGLLRSTTGAPPERRELDYVRQTAASVETAKEVKIFGLNDFLIERYRAIVAPASIRANRRIALRRAGWGGLFTALGTIGYYVAYAFIAWRTLHGEFTIGDLTFLAGIVPAPAHPARKPAHRLLAGRRAGALPGRPVLVLRDRSPRSSRRRTRSPFPKPIRKGFAFEDVGFRYPGAERWAVRHLTFDAARGRGAGAGGRERRRQDHPGEAARAPLRSRRGPHPARRARPARLRPRRSCAATSA